MNIDVSGKYVYSKSGDIYNKLSCPSEINKRMTKLQRSETRLVKQQFQNHFILM